MYRRNKIIVQRSDDLMQAALVACGRMGIIYSMVLRVIRPYALEEKIDRSQYWDDVKKWIANAADPKRIALMANRFVRVDVDVYPKPVFDWKTAALTFGAGLLGGLPLALVGLYAGLKGDKYRCWIYTRKALPLASCAFGTPPEYYGRKERAGANQGAMAELENQDDPDGNFRDPCSASNWLHQFLQDMKNELADIRNDALITYGALELAIDAAMFLGNEALALFLKSQQAVAGRIVMFAQAWIEYFTALQAVLPATHGVRRFHRNGAQHVRVAARRIADAIAVLGGGRTASTRNWCVRRSATRSWTGTAMSTRAVLRQETPSSSSWTPPRRLWCPSSITC